MEMSVEQMEQECTRLVRNYQLPAACGPLVARMLLSEQRLESMAKAIEALTIHKKEVGAGS
jgi:hypothetical protein